MRPATPLHPSSLPPASVRAFPFSCSPWYEGHTAPYREAGGMASNETGHPTMDSHLSHMSNQQGDQTRADPSSCHPHTHPAFPHSPCGHRGSFACLTGMQVLADVCGQSDPVGRSHTPPGQHGRKDGISFPVILGFPFRRAAHHHHRPRGAIRVTRLARPPYILRHDSSTDHCLPPPEQRNGGAFSSST